MNHFSPAPFRFDRSTWQDLRTPERSAFVLDVSPGLSRTLVDKFADTMCSRVRKVMLGNPETDAILSGGTCTGTIVLRSDKDICHLYKEIMRKLGLRGFSEESDPMISIGTNDHLFQLPLRTLYQTQVQIDPVDGSGDRKFGKPGTPSGDGHTSLVSFLDGDSPIGGICLRPAHGELWVFFDDKIEQWSINGDSTDRTLVAFHRPERPADAKNVVRVNTRPAYPHTNFPESVFQTASDLSRGRYRFQPCEAGGAGDCFIRLLRGDLDLVVSGRRYDWKSWDRDPFLKPIELLGGDLGTYVVAHEPISRARRNDPWCTEGVMAQIGCPEAAGFLRAALAIHDGVQQADGKLLLYRPG